MRTAEGYWGATARNKHLSRASNRLTYESAYSDGERARSVSPRGGSVPATLLVSNTDSGLCINANEKIRYIRYKGRESQRHLRGAPTSRAREHTDVVGPFV